MTAAERTVAAAVLAGLPGITPARLRRLLDTFGDPVAALHAVRTGDVSDVVRGDRQRVVAEWRTAVNVDDVRAVLDQRRTRVWIDGDDDFPIRDPLPDRPRVLLGEGDRADALARPRVGVVGTRAASPHGLADARELGAFLAGAGVTVVSGLALGIDGAAHEGAIDAGGRVVGVVATGLDVTYPRKHAHLYESVRTFGLVVSEHWYGIRPDAARFPVRNRIIAALSDVLVVVEATVSGGARITAGFAADYGRPVFALPGSRRNPAAAGCNALVADGALTLLDPGDVLLQLGCGRAGGRWRGTAEPPADPDESRALASLAGEPATVDQLVGRTGLPADRLAGALRRLEQSCRVERKRGRWWPC